MPLKFDSKHTAAHHAAEFLADEGNIAPGAREDGKLVWAALCGMLPNIDELWNTLPMVAEIMRRMKDGELQEVGPAGILNRDELIELVKEYRVVLWASAKGSFVCRDPECVAPACVAKRSRDKIENLFNRMGIK